MDNNSVYASATHLRFDGEYDDDSTMSIKQIRSMTGLSQRGFAKTYGIPRRTVESWESGRNSPPSYLARLLEYAVIVQGLFGVSKADYKSYTQSINNKKTN